MNVTLGTDPEWFLTNDGITPISAIGKFGGTKQKPKPVPKLGKGFAWQEDNVTVEYNTPPASSKEEWVENHLRIQEAIKDHAKSFGLKPLIKASAVFSKEELSDPQAWVFGCEPDFNAWTLKPNPRPESEDMFLRSAGGHIHVAFDGNKMEKIELVRVLDYVLGVPCTLADPDRRRQELYGKAGAFRFKKYGIEYRTPSNYWTKSKQWIEFIYTQTQYGLNAFNGGLRVANNIQQAIDSCDMDALSAFADSGACYGPMPK